jgi:two-component system sensor histidine kinase KdpD
MVYLLNDAQTCAALQHQVGVSDAYIARNRTIPVHQWPFHFIFAAGEARVIESGEALAPADKQILSELAIASLACVPLSTEGAVIGALCFGRKVGNVLYEFERPLLVAIGEILGAAVRRHLLHQHLKDAHREANLYLDIMTHDMRNAENVSGLYAEMLVDMLEGEAKQRAQKLQGSIQRSINTIKNVTTLRRIYRESPELKPVDLDGVIREEIGTATGSSVRYEGAKVLVLADELLPEIFSNLIGNAVKFGGQDVEIAICVERTDGDVRVLVEDTGRGIPDEMKVVLTRRFERGEGRERGEGLGLYIVRTLIRRYGGSVRVADRVPGHPEEGAAFRLAFRKADAEEIERSGPESAVAGMHEHP